MGSGLHPTEHVFRILAYGVWSVFAFECKSNYQVALILVILFGVVCSLCVSAYYLPEFEILLASPFVVQCLACFNVTMY